MAGWGRHSQAQVGISQFPIDPRADGALHAHTVVVIDRLISASTTEEMGRKLRQPVLAFATAQRADDGEFSIDSGAIAEGDRAVIASTLDYLRDGILMPAEPPDNVYEQLKDEMDVLMRAATQLREALAALLVDPDRIKTSAYYTAAEDIATVRVEAENVKGLAEDITALLYSWELSRDESERDRPPEQPKPPKRKNDEQKR